ncbi:IS256 family transposase [soil metagenome]
MKKDTVIELKKPEEMFQDSLTEILRKGARKLIAEAVESEFDYFMAQHANLVDEEGRHRIVRNGSMPEREILTSLGSVPVQVPRTKDRGSKKAGNKIHFTSAILPPYLRKTKTITELIPWLYLKGISTGDFSEALAALVGKDAAGLSSSTISRLKEVWQEELNKWEQRSLKGKRYVYFWVDGVHFGARLEKDNQCILVVIGATEDGTKELIAITDGYRESEQSWLALLLDLKRRGLAHGPKLAIGDGALGFWKALPQAYGETRRQRCWVHKTANVLDKLPKGLQKKAKQDIHQIWMAETKAESEKSFDYFLKAYGAKYPKATSCLEKDRDVLLTFYDFPAEHWVHIRTTNPIESTFATVRLRTAKTRGSLSRETMLTMVFKLCLSAQQRWRKLNGQEHLAEVIAGINFVDGLEKEKEAA